MANATAPDYTPAAALSLPACSLCGALVVREAEHTKWHNEEAERMQRWFDSYSKLRASYAMGTL